MIHWLLDLFVNKFKRPLREERKLSREEREFIRRHWPSSRD